MLQWAQSIVFKASDTSRANTTALAADPELTFDLAANQTYVIRAFLVTDAGNAASLKFRFDTGAAVITSAAIFLEGALTGQYAPATVFGWTGYLAQASDLGATDYVIAGNDTADYVEMTLVQGVIKVGNTGGTLSIKWAQNTSNATASVMKAGSSLFIERVE